VDRWLRPCVNLAPTLPADRAHNRPALVRRQERRAYFAPLSAMREFLIGDVGLRFLRLGGEGIIRRGRPGDAGRGAREALKQIAPRHFRRIKAHLCHIQILLSAIRQAENRRPCDGE